MGMLSTDYRRIAEACTQALGIKHVTVQVCGVGSDGFTRRQQRREAKVKQETKQNLLSEEADQKTSAEPKQTRPAKKTNKSPPKDPVPSGQVSASASAAKKTPKKSKTTKPKEEKKAAQEPESQPSGGLPFRVERTLLKTLPVVVDEVNGIPITTISRCSGDLDLLLTNLQRQLPSAFIEVDREQSALVIVGMYRVEAIRALEAMGF